MARLTLLLSAALLALAACGGASDVAGTEDAAVKAQAADAIDPKLAAEMEKLKKIQAELAVQKPAFDAAKAANDTIRLEELADAGNAHAQYDRAVRRLASDDYMLQQGGFEDMESASDAGLPEAQLWVGQRMAFGKEGYKLQPSSGLKLMEKAAAAGNLDAILAVAAMYAQDAYMSDKTKARDWYQRAADKGSEEARSWLDTLKSAETDS
jgi:TPR repeat protein